MRKVILAFILLGSVFDSFAQSDLEFRISRRINNTRNKDFDGFNQGLSQSADLVGIATPIFLYGKALKENDEISKKYAYRAMISTVGTYGVGYILKKTIKRDRPFVTYPSQIFPVRKKDGFSMPSGSTAIAFAAATNLTSSCSRWYVAVPAYSYATAVAYARVRSGEHYPSDALAGAALGTASVWISGQLMKWINKD